MKINSQTLLGHSHHLLPLLKIFSASKGKPIYIANVSIHHHHPPTPNSKQQTGESEQKKWGFFFCRQSGNTLKLIRVDWK